MKYRITRIVVGLLLAACVPCSVYAQDESTKGGTEGEKPGAGDAFDEDPFGDGNADSGGGEIGGYGAQMDAGYGGEMYSSSGMRSGGRNGTELTIALRSGDLASDRVVMKRLTVQQVQVFRYVRGSFKPLYVSNAFGPGMGGGGMGGGGMGGGGMGGYGGGGMGGMGGYGGGEGGYGGQATPALDIYALISKPEKTGEILRIVLATRAQRYGADQRSGKYLGRVGKLTQYDQLEDAVPLLAKSEFKMTAAELDIASKLIHTKIWKEDAVKTLHDPESKKAQLAAAEKHLRTALLQEFDTQIVRQELEIATIEKRIIRLRDEVARRKQAKVRVVDVKLGRIVLEAQGFLKD